MMGPPPGRAKAVVLVPHLDGIASECERSLRKPEEEGVHVVRSEGNAVTDALHDGFESPFCFDTDMGFRPPNARTGRSVTAWGGSAGRRWPIRRFDTGITGVTGTRGKTRVKIGRNIIFPYFD